MITNQSGTPCACRVVMRDAVATIAYCRPHGDGPFWHQLACAMAESREALMAENRELQQKLWTREPAAARYQRPMPGMPGML